MAEGKGKPQINMTENSRPLLKDLYDHVVLEVADKWRDLGVQLLLPSHQRILKVLAKDHPHDAATCCKRVLEKWLDTTTDATWNQLIRALKSPSIQLDYLAHKLEQIMIKEKSSSTCSPPNEKAKSQLNKIFQQHGINAKYDWKVDVTSGNEHNFTATLTYIIHGSSYRYESRHGFRKKQDAEEDAAQKALCDISSQLSHRGESCSYKQLLKERYCDERQLPPPEYTNEITSGGFVSTVNVPQYKPVRGAVHHKKKEAEQLAAKEALKQLKLLND